MMNSIGRIFRLTTFGESHGPAIGGVIDGVPSGFTISEEQIQHALDNRRPGNTAMGSQRRESDQVQLLSGLLSGKTLGTPIGFIIPNSDTRSADYEPLRNAYRPNHADYTYDAKYGLRDWRGGGRASARETACRVVAGAVASQILKHFGISINAYSSQIGNVRAPEFNKIDNQAIYASAVRCPDKEISLLMQQEIFSARAEGDSVGGAVSCIISGVPAGLGEPVFGKLQAMLSSAMMSIPAAKGFEYGIGFKAAKSRGSQIADIFVAGQPITTATNFSGGIQGGISNGAEITMRVAFKPAPTLMRPIESVDNLGNHIVLDMKGRHDPCVVPRAVPVVEAMAAIIMLDALLLQRASTLRCEL